MEKTLTVVISPATWCDQAAALLATTIRGAPAFTVADMRDEIERGGAQLYQVRDQLSDELAGYIVMRVELYRGGAEGVLVAAAGKIAGARLYSQILPTLERMFYGVRSIRVEPCRRGAVRELRKAGYLPTHAIMRKPVEPLAGDDVLEALQAAGGEACERSTWRDRAPDLRARPGKPHGGGGGSSSSASAQTTNNVDRRIVADAGSIGISSDSSTVTINALDNGAIAQAFELAKSSDQKVTQSLEDVLGFASNVFDKAATRVDRAASSTDAAAALAAKAYDNAKGEGDAKTYVALAGLAAVAIVAIKVFSK